MSTPAPVMEELAYTDGRLHCSSPSHVQITHDQIAEAAYRLWQDRGAVEGSPEEDWYRAEAELRGDIAL